MDANQIPCRRPDDTWSLVDLWLLILIQEILKKEAFRDYANGTSSGNRTSCVGAYKHKPMFVLYLFYVCLAPRRFPIDSPVVWRSLP